MSTLTPDLAAALALAEAILQHGVEGVDTPPSNIIRSIATDEISQLATAPPDLSIKETQRVTGLGQTKTRELIADGVFEAFNDGPRVRVTLRSIARRRIALAILSHPADGPRLKIREPQGALPESRASAHRG